MQKQIGRYEIRREIGRGGMATVYLAFDPSFRRQVAVKVLPRQFTHDPRYLARFEREAHTIATLEHAAIVPVYDFGDHGDAPYLVMRYMSGGTLRNRLSGDPVSLEVIAPALRRLAPALDKAHALNIIHRDIKPANILFDDDGNSYLGDFGIARLAEASQTMTVVGTPAYMSPEQVQGDQEVDGRADIYALGVILYELFTGCQPYEANTPTKQMMAHVLEPIPDVLTANPDLPASAQAVINKAMAKDREDRYTTASELAAEVSVLAGSTETTDPDAAAAVAAAAFASHSVVPPKQVTRLVEPIELTPADEVAAEAAAEKPEKIASKGASAAAAAAGLAAAGAGGTGPPIIPPVEGGGPPPVDGSAKGNSVPGWIWWAGALALLSIVIISSRFIFGSQTADSPELDLSSEEVAQGETDVGGETGQPTGTATVEATLTQPADDGLGAGGGVAAPGQGDVEPTATVELPIQMAEHTATPNPTYTPYPTNTPLPTATPYPTDTPRPMPTNTPMPTATDVPQGLPGRIAFVSSKNGPDSIFVMDADYPSAAYQLTHPNSSGYDWWPAWCGDSEIVYERADDTKRPSWQEIYSVNLNTGDEHALTSTSKSDGSGFNGVPGCSPDGRRIVVSRSHSNGDWLAGTIDRSNNSYSPIHGDQYKAGHASWSPDGGSVVFMQFPARSSSDFHIYRVHLGDPSSFLNLTQGSGYNSKYPDWSPAGDVIAFACGEDVNRVWSLCSSHANQTGVSVLYPNIGYGSEHESRRSGRAGHFITPSWSPDGRYVAFATNELHDNWEIYAYEIATGQLINLTNTPSVDELHPRWGP